MINLSLFLRFFSFMVILTYSGEQRRVEDYYPLSLGNTWTYSTDPPFDNLTDTMTEELDSSFFYNGLLVYSCYHWFHKNVTSQWYNGLLYFDGEIRHYFFIEVDTSEYEILLKEPLEVGHEWKFGKGKRAKIVSTDVTVNVPAGVFKDCIKVCYWSEKEKIFI